MNKAESPLLSVIVVGYRMAAQLANTLFTLDRAYQRNVEQLAYEVIVVENQSTDCLTPQHCAALPGNFHYFRRHDTSQSPVAAVNFAFAQCRGQYIGLIVDGARLLSPRILEYAALAYRMDANSLTVVPGYHLGNQQQHQINDEAAAYAAEAALLATIGWRSNGYLLFTVATLGGGNAHGFLHPFMESNCIFASREHFRRIGNADERFQLAGGGSINLHTYRALGLHRDVRLVVLPGEGSFHQFHGGVTTRARADRSEELRSHKQQLHEIWHNGFHSLRREPSLLGAVTPWALPFLQQSAQNASARAERLGSVDQALWQDDEDLRDGTFFNPAPATTTRDIEDPNA